MPGIFATFAPRYWKSNFSVVPLVPNEKRPIIKSWSGYCNNLPAEETRRKWLSQFGDHGIGLLLGTEVCSGWRIAAIDIDDDVFMRVPEALLGSSPCKKRGKKGVTVFVKVPAGEKIKSGPLQAAGDRQAGDMLFNSRMTVLPPSVHPEIRKPYNWIGKDLLSCTLEELPELREGAMYILRLVFASEQVGVLVTGTATHDAARDLAWNLVRAGCEDETIERLVAALLPRNYSGNTLQELPELIVSARAKLGDVATREKGEKETQASQLVHEARSGGVELFHDGDRSFASIPQDEGGKLTYPITSITFQRYLRRKAYQSTAKPVSRQVLGDAIATLDAIALFKGSPQNVSIRVGAIERGLAVDLGRADGKVVEITPDGWSLTSSSKARFYRASGFEELPEPIAFESLVPLQKLLGLSDEAFRGVCAFLVNALDPRGPYFVLHVEGAQGSGKSILCSIIKLMLDPNKALRNSLPDNERDLMIQAKEYHLLNYDNTSGMRANISDALCKLATGGGIGVRKLYTDEELQVFNYKKPIVLNGISGFVKRPDLLERAIPVRLEAMCDDQRRTEEDIMAEFFSIRAQLLGALYSAVAASLRRLSEVELPRGIRMADAARRIAAAEFALGFPDGALIDMIRQAQEDLFIERVSEDPLFILLIENVISDGPFEGHIKDLFQRLFPAGSPRDAGLPRTPSHLSSQLSRLAPAMAKADVMVEFLGKDKQGRKVRIWRPTYSPERRY